MLNEIKLSLRMFHNELDADVQSNIDACMIDMQRVGISAKKAVSNSDNPLIRTAAKMYCKWQYDFEGKGEQYHKAYIDLRDALSLHGPFKEQEDDANV